MGPDVRETPRRPDARAAAARQRLDLQGPGVLGYALVAVVFVVVFYVVLTALGDTIGASLQDLIDQLPIGV